MTSTPTASTVNPSDAIKTHVQEMTPAQKLAAHDAAARERNAGLAPETPAAPEPVSLTFENLCGVVLDVVKDFARQGYDPSTIAPEHVVEKARQRFPDGVSLVGEVETVEETAGPDPLRLDRVKGADEVREDRKPGSEDRTGAIMEDDDDPPAGDGVTEGGNPIGSPEAAEEVSKANEALKAHDEAAKKTAPAKKAAKKAATKKAPTRKPKGPAPTSKP
jgi:hypothetical protein